MIDKTIPGWETLLCLFLHGPTWDGDVPSKSERDACVKRGHVARGDGYQWLTEEGMRVCLRGGFGKEKEHREFKRRALVGKLEAENDHLRRMLDAKVTVISSQLAPSASGDRNG